MANKGETHSYIVSVPPTSRYTVIARSVAEAKEEAWGQRRASIRHGIGEPISKVVGEVGGTRKNF